MNRRANKKPRQLALTEQDEQAPRWATLPEACRRDVVELLMMLFRNEHVAGEESEDE